MSRKPDSTHAARLQAAGFCVMPLESHRKHSTFKWGDDIRGKGQDFCSRFFQDQCNRRASTTTGWALLPKQFDQPKLLILDVDAYDAPQSDVEAALYGKDTDPPEGHTVVQSPSGGLHFYYRLPESCLPKALPTEFSLSEAARGEVRVSGEMNRLVVLPGSVVMNKKGQLARYELLSGDLLDPPWAPEGLIHRLRDRVPATQDAPSRDRLPTEAEHLLVTIGYIPDNSVKRGGWNNWIAQVGEMLGRIWARDRPDDATVNRFWSVMRAKFDGAADPDEFGTAFRSGYQTGRKNADSYGAKDKHPTETMLKVEVQNVCGGPLWLVENVSQERKREGFTMGFGGSAKRPHEAKRTADIKSLSDNTELLGHVLKISDADPDAFTQSPFVRQPGWIKQLKISLFSNREINYAGLPMETVLQHALEDAGMDAVRNAQVGEYAAEGCPTEPGKNRKAWATSAWWHVDGATLWLRLGTALVDDMVREFGPAGARCLKKQLKVQDPTGFQGAAGQKAYKIALADLPDELWKSKIEEEVTKVLLKRRKRDGN